MRISKFSGSRASRIFCDAQTFARAILGASLSECQRIAVLQCTGAQRPRRRHALDRSG
jgi:hypothetical protein